MVQLGRALGILVREVMRSSEIDADLAAFHAPSECYADVHRGDARRRRHAMRRACHAAGVRNQRLLRRAMRRVMGNDAWIYRHYGFVPY